MKNTQSRFFCTRCGKEGIPIQRQQNAQRENGHLKYLYCINCQDIVNHVEIKENSDYTEEDFKKEFELGRFVDGQREPIGNLIQCSNEKCEYNIDNRC